MTPALDGLRADVRQALRGMRRAPGFSLAVILTLALGIGANTAIFSVVDQLLLRPLPYPDGGRIVRIYETVAGPTPRSEVSPANLFDWERDTRAFELFAAWDDSTLTLTGFGDPLRLQGQIVSAQFFRLLGVEPMLGRTITAEDDRPDAPQVIVLSHALWRRQFNGDPAVVNRLIQLNDQPTRVIGVMPEGFRFISRDYEYWRAYRLDRGFPYRERSGRFANVIARMKPGVTLEAAGDDMATVARALAARYVFNRNTSVELVPLRDLLAGPSRSALLVLYGAVVLLLSIACLNVVSLLIARASARSREIAIRLAVGASRGALIRQLLVESVLLAVFGGLLAIPLARSGLTALLDLTPELSRWVDVSVDGRVLLYTATLSLVAGAIVGLAPAVGAARRALLVNLRATDRAVTPVVRGRQLLVVGQVAMSVVLLTGATLLVRTVIALNGGHTGVDRASLLTLDIELPTARYPGPEQIVRFYREAAEAVRRVPGVRSAAGAYSLPVTGTPLARMPFAFLGQSNIDPQRQSVVIRLVTPGYFRTVGTPIVRGREFTDDDLRPNVPQVLLVNQAFVDTYLPNQDPLTTRFAPMPGSDNALPIAGVVGNVTEGLWSSPTPTLYIDHGHAPVDDMSLVVRADDPANISRAVIAALRQVDPNLAPANVRTFEAVLGESVARERLIALVSGTFALSGLLLVALGLYGLLAFIVSERTKEIGIRMALGAQLVGVLTDTLGSALRLVGVGAAAGLAAALLISRSIGSLLFGVSPYDPWTYAGVVVALLMVAAAATVVPARRAASVDPVVALRAE